MPPGENAQAGKKATSDKGEMVGMEDKTYYLCDPRKNVRCQKRNCIYSKGADYYGCSRTANINYSVDGKPLPPDEWFTPKLHG